MACDCKVNRKLDYLHRKYGKKIPVSRRMVATFNVKEFFRVLFVFLLMVLFFPLLLIHVIFTSASNGKRISIRKIMDLVKIGHGRK